MPHAPGEDPLETIESTFSHFTVHPQHRSMQKRPDDGTIWVLRWMLSDYQWMIAEIKRLRSVAHKAG